MSSPKNSEDQAQKVAEFAQGSFTLDRYPPDKRDQLRAWDAADEYVLADLFDEINESNIDPAEVAPHIVLVNDHFGALAVAIERWFPKAEITSLGDSVVSQKATQANLTLNDADLDRVALRSTFGGDGFDDSPIEDANLVIVRIPKSSDLLDAQLGRLRPLLNEGTKIVGAAMTRHVHTSTSEAFERHIGPTSTSLAKKKARLVFSSFDPDLSPQASNWPREHIGTSGGTNISVVSLPGVFAAGRVDQGTQIFLDSIPRDITSGEIIDLGCGDGVVGTLAATSMEHGGVTFVDESFAAVQAAEATWLANQHQIQPEVFAHFVASNVLERDGHFTEASYDFVFCNPPFHSDHAVTDQIAFDMFRQAKDALRSGGEMWVVGNRHLHYHAKLKRAFGNSEVMASNTKFVVMRAIK